MRNASPGRLLHRDAQPGGHRRRPPTQAEQADHRRAVAHRPAAGPGLRRGLRGRRLRRPQVPGAGAARGHRPAEEALRRLHRRLLAEVPQRAVRPLQHLRPRRRPDVRRCRLQGHQGRERSHPRQPREVDGDLRRHSFLVSQGHLKTAADNHRLTGTWKEAYLNLTVEASPEGKTVKWVLAPKADPRGAEAWGRRSVPDEGREVGPGRMCPYSGPFAVPVLGSERGLHLRPGRTRLRRHRQRLRGLQLRPGRLRDAGGHDRGLGRPREREHAAGGAAGRPGRAGVAAVQERATVAPVRGRVGPLAMVVVTLGFGLVVQGLALRIWKEDPLRAEPFSAGFFELFDARLSRQVWWVWGTTAVVLAGVVVLFRFTGVGRAMRACAINPIAARLQGIRVGRMSLAAFALAGGLSGLVGAVTVPLTLVRWNSGLVVGLIGFIAAALGRLHEPDPGRRRRARARRHRGDLGRRDLVQLPHGPRLRRAARLPGRAGRVRRRRAHCGAWSGAGPCGRRAGSRLVGRTNRTPASGSARPALTDRLRSTVRDRRAIVGAVVVVAGRWRPRTCSRTPAHSTRPSSSSWPPSAPPGWCW